MYKKYPAICLLLFSIYVCVASWRMDVGSLRKPGSGFMPFWSGAFITILSIILLIQGILSDKAAPREDAQEKVRWKSISLTLAYFFAYVLSLEYVGFIIGTILFVGVILKSIERKGWFLSGWVSVVMSVASYYIFKVWLQAELPRGFFGF